MRVQATLFIIMCKINKIREKTNICTLMVILCINI